MEDVFVIEQPAEIAGIFEKYFSAPGASI
jgi:hypothetical protein